MWIDCRASYSFLLYNWGEVMQSFEGNKVTCMRVKFMSNDMQSRMLVRNG